MKFNKIVAVDNLGLIKEAYEKLYNYGRQVIFYSAEIKDDEELKEIIKDAECLLVSWDTVINKNVINSCENLKYIGLCCSLFEGKSSNVDIKTAREKGIKLLGVNNYGDNVTEFIISEIIRLIHGYGNKQWKELEQELEGQKIGIVGLGNTGRLLANTLNFLGSDVYYNARSRKDDIEKDIKYLELDKLLEKVDIISTHLPKNTFILDKNKLEQFGNNKIIVNTSIGPTFVVEDIKDWLKNRNNYLICDSVGIGEYINEFIQNENFIFTNKVSAKTIQMDTRLSNAVIENLNIAISEIYN